MKILICAKDKEPSAEVDPRFGRAAFFLLHDTETGAWAAIPNDSALLGEHGAGVQSAEQVCKLKPGAVICGHIGPRAIAVLQAAGVRIYRGEGCTVSEAAEALLRDQLPELEDANRM